MTWAAIVVGGVAVVGTGVNMIMANQNRADAPDNSLAYKSGQLLKSEYEDWKTNFAPIEQDLLQQISWNNPAILPNALDEAREKTEGTYNAMGGILERQNRALGVTETPQQEATNRRLLDLNKAKSIAGAENETRANVRKMDEAILMSTARR